MAMNDIRSPVHIIQCCQCCFSKITIARNIINQICIWISIAEKFFIVNKIIYNAIPYIFHDTYIIRSSILTQIHLERSSVNHLLLIFPRNTFVAWKNNFYVTILFYQSFRKRIHNIAQTTGLHKRITLRSDKGDTFSWCLRNYRCWLFPLGFLCFWLFFYLFNHWFFCFQLFFHFFSHWFFCFRLFFHFFNHWFLCFRLFFYCFSHWFFCFRLFFHFFSHWCCQYILLRCFYCSFFLACSFCYTFSCHLIPPKFIFVTFS